ncbi:hypothetical protein A2U01_0107621, partial [Trifolium medium]|nr:hypothetical protein [Trifolium medium]
MLRLAQGLLGGHVQALPPAPSSGHAAPGAGH